MGSSISSVFRAGFFVTPPSRAVVRVEAFFWSVPQASATDPSAAAPRTRNRRRESGESEQPSEGVVTATSLLAASPQFRARRTCRIVVALWITDCR